MDQITFILASTSPYRRELIEKLGISFTCEKPACDEDLLKSQLLQNGATAQQLAAKLSFAKGYSIFNLHRQRPTIILSGDQLVHFNGEILGKAHTPEGAFLQLKKLNGKTHQLITAVSLFSPQGVFHLNHITELTMKNLNDQEIKNYIEKDQTTDCAGSYKIEKSGLILFDRVQCDDFSAIQGIPLIWVSQKLKEFNYEFFNKFGV